MIARRNVIASLIIGFGIGAGLGPGSPAEAETPGKTKVVATFSILGDFVREVGGERIELTTLVGPNGDGHVYSPTPADAKKLAGAKVVFTNGLKFEGWIDRLIKASGTKATMVVATRGIKAIEADDDDHGKKEAAGHAHGGLDPHAWQDVGNAKIYVANVRDALVRADPDGKAIYEANAAAYLARLDTLETDVKATITGIPAEKRKIITSHDAFTYFAKAYGLEFIAPQGVSTEAEASARDVARIIRQIRKDKITAVFIENISDPRLVERIAKETGARIGGRIYSDALSDPTGPAGTYIEMMRNNIRAFSAALVS